MAEYACATKDEMETFIKNLKVTTVLEHIHEITESDGTTKNAGNLVIYFTPFPIKYINYLKTHQDKNKGRLHRTKQDVVYIQLLRMVQRSTSPSVTQYTDGTYKYSKMNFYTMRNRCGWGKKSGAASTCESAFCCNSHINSTRLHECVTFSGKGNKYAQSCPKFKYALSPVDAARGYAVILRDFRDDTATNDAADSPYHCTMMYGTVGVETRSDPGSFNFGRGVIGAVTFDRVRNTGKDNGTKVLHRSDIVAWLDTDVECNSKSLIES